MKKSYPELVFQAVDPTVLQSPSIQCLPTSPSKHSGSESEFLDFREGIEKNPSNITKKMFYYL